MADSVHYLGTEFGAALIDRTLERFEEATLIAGALEEQGLRPQPDRAHTFSVFSRESLAALAIVIVPFSSKDGRTEGGLSVSEGGHAQAVVVEVKDRVRIGGFTHLAVSDGKVRAERFSTDDLPARGGGREGRSRHEGAEHSVRAIAERAGKIKTAKPLIELESHQVRSLASLTYSRLLGDDFSRSVHSGEEIEELREEAGIVSEIGLFVLFRTQGSSCCSCSTSCWGSCSSSCSYGG